MKTRPFDFEPVVVSLITTNKVHTPLIFLVRHKSENAFFAAPDGVLFIYLPPYPLVLHFSAFEAPTNVNERYPAFPFFLPFYKIDIENKKFSMKIINLIIRLVIIM